MRKAGLALLILPTLLGACEEMRKGPELNLAPVEFIPATGEPGRGLVLAAASSFADRGQGLAGRPMEAARAVAQLELLTEAVSAGGRWAPLPPAVGFALRGARQEVRGALGVLPSAPAEEVVQALGGVFRALKAGDRGLASAALSPTLYRPGGEETLDRLGALGPLPQAERATALLAAEVARLDARGGWGRSGRAENWREDYTTTGLGY